MARETNLPWLQGKGLLAKTDWKGAPQLPTSAGIISIQCHTSFLPGGLSSICTATAVRGSLLAVPGKGSGCSQCLCQCWHKSRAAALGTDWH